MRTHAASIVAEDQKHPGDEDVVAKLTADLGGRATDAEIRAQLQVAFLEAERQFRDGV